MKKLILIIVLISLGLTATAQTAEEYYNRGFSKIQLNDFKGAIEDLTKGIEIDPNEFVYYLRGLAKEGLDDY